MTDITVPTLGESVTEATVAKWLKKAGDPVAADETLVELETDKVTLEVNAPAAGVLSQITAEEGATVNVGALLGTIGEAGTRPSNGAAKPTTTTAAAPAVAEQPAVKQAPAPQPAPAAPRGIEGAGPAARKIVEEKGLDPSAIAGSGKDGRITKGDVLAAQPAPKSEPVQAPIQAPTQAKAPSAPPPAPAAPRQPHEREERVRMTRLRQRIAQRLKEAQNTAAMLSTFNEVDMSKLMALRATYKDSFEKKHKVKLGFMGLFVKAAILALKEYPAVNAEIDGQDLVYKNYYDIGVAVSTPTGLVVPVVRDCDAKSLAEIEAAIGDVGTRAREGKLGIEELAGGTFTITNGGVFGSLLSTPILNPPQSGILGMHKIQERPVAVAGKVEIRPMMYLALTYDHRVIDGREAVSFLVKLKDAIEDPQRLLLDI